MARKKLGEMLIEAGVLDEMQLRGALADQRRWGRSLGRTLVELNMIAESDLVQILGKQLGIESVEIDTIEIPERLLRIIPLEMIRQHQMVAFAQPMKFLDVAMVDPTNEGVVDELRIRTQLNIRPFLAGPRQLARTISRLFGDGIAGRPDITIHLDAHDAYRPPPVRAALRQTRPPPLSTEPLGGEPARSEPARGEPLRTAPLAPARDAEIDALQERISQLEALVARDETVLRKVLALLIDKGVATRDEIVERLG